MAEHRVERVTVFEDRATVTRAIVLPEAGRIDVVIDGVTPLVMGRFTAALPSDEVELEDLVVERTLRERRVADPEEAVRLEERLKAAVEAADVARTAVERGREEVALLEAAAGTARAWLPRAMAGDGDGLAWLAGLREVAEAHGAAVPGQVDLEGQAARLGSEARYVEKLLANARQATSAWTGTLHLRVRAHRPGVLRLRYTVPCAAWRPVHRATLEGQAITWELGAMVWNATGEDWTGAIVACSTARPAERARPPELTDDRVRTQRRDREIVVEAREESIQVARAGGVRQEDAPGVDDGGEARVFESEHPVTLPSTGRPVHLPLGEWQAPATVRWVCHPEQSGAAALRSRQTNGDRRPLLAGPVDLVRDGVAVGRGKVDLVPPGEPFELGWGSHDAVRVTRKREVEVDTKRITGRQIHRFEVALRVVNLGDEAVSLEIRERVPVSELKEVLVSAASATPSLAEGPDGDGRCTWRLALGARERKVLTLGYRVEAPAKVTLPW